MLPVHVDVAAGDEAAFAEGTSPQEASSLGQVRRVATLGPGGDGWGGRVQLAGAAAVEIVGSLIDDAFDGAVQIQGELRHACGPLHRWTTSPLS